MFQGVPWVYRPRGLPLALVSGWGSLVTIIILVPVMLLEMAMGMEMLDAVMPVGMVVDEIGG